MAQMVHGKNGLIYVSGTEIQYANAWSLAVDHESAAGNYFGAGWTERKAGVLDWSGTVAAFHNQDAKVLYNAAVHDGSVAILVYPKRSELASYWSGDAIFSFAGEGGVGGLVGQSVSFVAAASLTITGFT